MARHELSPLPETAAWRLSGAHDGFEVARFHSERDRIALTGTSVGVEHGVPWAFRYAIELDRTWRTRRAVIDAGDGRHLELEADGAGRWLVNGTHAPAVDGCLDVDLEGSLVTNTIPVHRLALAVGERADAPAAYVRANTQSVERVDQTYARLPDEDGALVFDYASPRFDYRERLRFASDGLVLDYRNIGSRMTRG